MNMLKSPAAALLICLGLTCQASLAAELNRNLADPYLQREFDWSMYIDPHDISPFLNFPGSQIGKMTEMRISARTSQRSSAALPLSSPAPAFEEFWYQEGRPIGLRRFSQPAMSSQDIGIIILGRGTNNTAASANIILRLLVDLTVQNKVVSVVLVPTEKYDQIASELGKYSFFKSRPMEDGALVSIHMRSYPYERDDYFYRHQGRF